MDPQTIIDTATSVNASSLGVADATAAFRHTLRSSYKVNTNLTKMQRRAMESQLDFPVIFVGGQTVTNDHPVLVAMRNLARDVYESEFHVSRTSIRTLVVGAAAREFRLYSSNPSINYWVHMSEGKDVSRVVMPMLDAVAKELKKKAKKTDRRVFVDPKKPTEPRPVVKRYNNMLSLIDDYRKLNKMPAGISTEPIEAEQLLFEDSFYNYDETAWLDLFSKTGAKVAYGYGLLPNELVFDDMPANSLYTLTNNKCDSMSIITFRGGYCNGYVHESSAWSCLLRNVVIARPGYNFSLMVEITARVGPFAVFKVIRVARGHGVIRELELPDRDCYVKLLDIYKCVNIRTGKINRPFVYFSVHMSEYYDLLNYLMGLKPESVSLQNAITFVRRRMGGMSLVTKELLAPWHLRRADVYRFSLCVYMQARVLLEKTDLVITQNVATDTWAKLKRMAMNVFDIAFFPIYMARELFYILFAENLVGKLVLFPSCSKMQGMTTRGSGEPMDYGLTCDFPDESDLPTCPICFDLLDKLGDQKVKCEHKPSKVKFALTDTQLQNLKTSLINTDGDPQGIREVKKRAAARLPPAGFEHVCRVNYIRGGPGCGKSYIIRQLADSHDLVYAPFTKLKPDYEFLTGEDGEKYDIPFKTTHRGYETTGFRRIFVDEFTSLPYEHLAVVAYLNQAEEIFLVGDESQTKVSEPDEGLYIGNHLDLTSLGKHTLMVNFRNPRDVVAKLNEVFGYEMEAHSTVERSVEFIRPSEMPQIPATKMAFSAATSHALFDSHDFTVRANQGGTCDNAFLACTGADSTQHLASELQIVGISRHKEKLYVVVDDSQQAMDLKAKLGFTDEFYMHMQEYLTFAHSDVQEIDMPDDPALEEVLKPQQPCADTHLLAETLMPSYAVDDDITSANVAASHVVGDDFRSGSLDPDILTQVNQRGHPKKTITEYYSYAAGAGLHFIAHHPIQTLQVLQDRYIGKQPKYNYDRSAEITANKIADSFIDEHMTILDKFDETVMDDTIRKFLQAAAQKNYNAQFAGIDAHESRLVRFHLKGIFKPKLLGLDPYKVGQGISAWSKEAQSMFGACFRIINERFKEVLNPNVIYDNGISEIEFLRRVNDAFSEIPAVAMNGVTDGEKYDSKQNRFTQQIERRVLRRMGVSEDFCEMYYSFRNDYVIQADNVRAVAGSEKTSGEPGTLLLNTILAAATSNYVLRGEGPMCMVVKGDDGCKRQCKLAYDVDRIAEIGKYTPLNIKVNISTFAEFCGFSVVEGAIAPNVVRKLCKLVGHRFRDYDHFTEYQKSLRDFSNFIEKMGRSAVIGTNAHLYETTYDEMEHVVDCINAFSHINRQQYNSTFSRRTEEVYVPVMGETGLTMFC